MQTSGLSGIESKRRVSQHQIDTTYPLHLDVNRGAAAEGGPAWRGCVAGVRRAAVPQAAAWGGRAVTHAALVVVVVDADATTVHLALPLNGL